jgi:hypothetical protein
MKNMWTRPQSDYTAQDIDRWSNPPPSTFWAKWVGGMVTPFILTLYGIHSIVIKTAHIPGKRGSPGLDLQGTDAVLLGCAILAFAFFFHTRYFWGNQKRLVPYSEGGKILALLFFCIFLMTLLYRLFGMMFST